MPNGSYSASMRAMAARNARTTRSRFSSSRANGARESSSCTQGISDA